MVTVTGNEVHQAAQTPRHLNNEGRNSAFSYLFGNRKGGLMGLWRRNMKTEVLPLVILMGGAIGMATTFGIRHLFWNPDVRVNKVARKQTVRENFEDGRQWMRHRATIKNSWPKEYVRYSTKPATPSN